MARFVRFIRALRTALFGVPHRHIWKTIQVINLVGSESATIPIGRQYILQCQECGWMRKLRF